MHRRCPVDIFFPKMSFSWPNIYTASTGHLGVTCRCLSKKCSLKKSADAPKIVTLSYMLLVSPRCPLVSKNQHACLLVPTRCLWHQPDFSEKAPWLDAGSTIGANVTGAKDNINNQENWFKIRKSCFLLILFFVNSSDVSTKYISYLKLFACMFTNLVCSVGKIITWEVQNYLP